MRIVFVCSGEISHGVGLLSSYLKKHGFEVLLIFDPNQFNKYLRNNYLSKIFSRERSIIEEIKQLKPDIVAFSVLSAHYQWASKLAENIKKEVNVPIIFGGIHPTLVPETVIKNDSVDMVCIGEGEEPMLELLRSLECGEKNYSIQNIWFKNNGKIIQNQIRPLIEDLDSLPFPDRQLFYSKFPKSYRNYPMIITSRGCPFRCTYCANNAMAKIFTGKGKYLRQRSPENVIAELEELIKNYKVKYFIFADDVFTANKKWIEIFISMYREKINKPFVCSTHPIAMTQELAYLLKDAGCILIAMGLQSGCEEIRVNTLKRFEKNCDFMRAAEYCRIAGIKFSVDAILNLPYDNPETLRESIRFYNEIRPNIVLCYRLVYFPKTEIIDISIKTGIISEEFRELINEGKAPVYLTAPTGSNVDDDYKKFALLFTIIPLLPPRMIQKIIESKKFLSFLGRMPIYFILFFRLIVNIKAGTGFIYFTALNSEISKFVVTLRMKLGI